MNKIIAFASILITAASVAAQPFEGKITYKNSYVSKLPNLKDQELSTIMGTKQVFYIREGNYKSIFNGTFENWQLYNNKENKIYSKFSASDTIFWNNAGYNDDTIYSATVTKDKTIVLGYTCDELVFICKSGIQKFYYSQSLKVKANLYKRLKYANWYEFIKRSNAIPLKIILESQQFSMESVAIVVTPMKIDNNEFQLPANSIVAKSPY